MLTEIDNFYLDQDEPNKGCLLALRDIILSTHTDILSTWKYKLPFFEYRGKMFCYLWIDKKTKQPYIGVVEGKKINHPLLVQGDRKRIKIIPVNPNKDIEINEIKTILDQAIDLYLSGEIKTKY